MPRAARIAIGIVVALVALVVAGDLVMSSPRLCGSCHEMGPRTEAWRQSAHAEVTCVKCHTGPHAWYEYPQAVAARAGLVSRDVQAHLSGAYADPVDERSAGTAPLSDAICLQCHDPNRRATSGFRIKIEHAKHAARNKSCISCHVRTAHPLETRGTPLSLMGQCFTCHGSDKAEYAKASNECDVCHPGGYELVPASHKAAQWQPNHGKVALEDRAQCAMCHEKEFCTSCHGLEMPHPKGWERGKTGHAVVAERGREVCTKCHTEKPDLCSMCHHKDGYEPARGTWTGQHFLEVREKGVAFCMDCHSPVSCTDCHVRWSMGEQVDPLAR